MAGDVTCKDSGPIDNSTLETQLADPNDRMIFLPVKTADGVEQRPYEVHFPKGVDPSTKGLDLWFAADGVTANKPYTGMAVDNGINAAADAHHLIAVYPLWKPRETGVPYVVTKTMRDPNGPGLGVLPTDSSYNDISYQTGIIDKIRSDYQPRNIFLVGMSLGRQDLGVVASQYPPGTFVGMFSDSGTVFKGDPLPPRGLSETSLRGTDDPILPDAGGMPRPSEQGRIAHFMARQFIDTDRADSSSPESMLQNFLKVNGGLQTQFHYNGNGYYIDTYLSGSGATYTDARITGAGHYWFGRSVGGCHETLATPINGYNPNPSPISATDFAARQFGEDKK